MKNTWAIVILYVKTSLLSLVFSFMGINFASAQTTDIVITKTVNDNSVNEGQSILYTIEAENDGDADATGLIITDLLPTGLTFDLGNSTIPSGTTYDPLTGEWDIGDLDEDDDIELELAATVDQGTASNTITNIASVTSLGQTDSDLSNNTASVDILVNTPDIKVTKTVNKANPKEGQSIIYTIKVKNEGTQSALASGLIVTDVLPSGLTFDLGNSTIPAGTTYDPITGKWDIGTLLDNASLNLKLVVTVDQNTAASTITNTASVSSLDQPDSNSSNNTASVDIVVKGSDLEIVKTVNNLNPNPGDVVTYTIVVTNLGPQKAKKIIINDDLPSLVNFNSYTSTSGSYTQANGEWDVDQNLKIGESETLTITATVDLSSPNGLYSNTASVLSVDQGDSFIDNNSSSAIFTIGEADLSISNSLSPIGTLFEGDSITYTIIVENNGPSEAHGVEVLDFLPSAVTYTSHSGGTYDSNTGEWNIGSLVNNGTTTLLINATVNSETAGFSVTNAAEVSGLLSDPNTSNNLSDVTFLVHGADLAVTNTVDNIYPVSGDLVTYTITVSNNGPDAATNVIVEDSISENLVSLNFSSTIGQYTIGNHTWDVGTLSNGQSETLTVTGIISISETFTSNAIASADQSDDNEFNNSSSVTVKPYISFEEGSCIIDMGVMPQTVNNGLKPYGLVYELTGVNKIPVYWSINGEKSWSSNSGTTVTAGLKEDQVDFTVNGKEYKGGPFIIPAEFMDVAGPLITQYVAENTGNASEPWDKLTVDCNLPVFSAPVHSIILNWPNAVLDTDNGGIIESAFYGEARLYDTQFYDQDDPENNQYRIASPIELTPCDDLFALPHADPHEWEVAEQVHLKNWIKTNGYLWMACHAVSSMEGLIDIPDALDPDGQDMMFLTNNGMVLWDDHNNTATPPFDYSLESGIFYNNVAADPLMQFVGIVDNALSGGSEEIYIVNPEGYRDGVIFPVRDLDHAQTLPGGVFAPGPAASVVYGRAFSNPNNGIVMYEASHTIAGDGETQNVAAARIFGNFLLESGLERSTQIKINDVAAKELCGGESTSMSVSIKSKSYPNVNTWSATPDIGTFSTSPDSLSTTYTAPSVLDTTNVIIRFTTIDNCGRNSFMARNITILPDAVPTINGNLDFCSEAEYIYTSEANMANYTWNVTGGTVIAGGGDENTITIFWDTYSGNIELSYTIGNGCSGSNNVDILALPCPIATNNESLANIAGNVTQQIVNEDDGDGLDIDPNGTLILATIDLNPATTGVQSSLVVTGEGSWTVDGTGNVTFAPEAGFTNDPTPIEYTINDNDGNTSNSASIIVDYVPVATDDLSDGNAINNNVTVDILANDTDGDLVDVTKVSLELIGLPMGATCSVTDADGDCIEVTLLGQGIYSVDETTGAITFDPVAGFTADPYPITYTVEDHEGNPVSVILTIDYLNTTLAEDDINQTTVDMPVGGNVLTNDSDPQGDTHIITLIDTNEDGVPDTAPTPGLPQEIGNGTLDIDPVTGEYTFTPDLGFVGTVVIKYTVCDDGITEACTTPTLVIDVSGLDSNDEYPPIAQDDNATTEPDINVDISILGNDSDIDGSIVSSSVSLDATKPGLPVGTSCTITGADGDCIQVTVPGEGVYTVDETTGVVTFDPEPAFSGETTPLPYTICDDNLPTPVCADAEIKVTISDPALNEMTAEDDANTGFAGETLTGNILANDIDPDGSTGTATISLPMVDIDGNGVLNELIIAAPTVIYGKDPYNPGNNIVAGTLTVNDDGTYSYESHPDFVGTVYVPYTACDNDVMNACDETTLYLTTAPFCSVINVKVLLEGPYQHASSVMSTFLNDYHLLPGQDPTQSNNVGAQLYGIAAPTGQPYNEAPWNYTGTEGDNYGDAGGKIAYPATVTDWILVSIRENFNSLSPIWQCAALLYNDGTVTFPKECPCLETVSTEDYYILIEQRNHLSVMSQAVTPVNGVLAIDFTTTDSWKQNIESPQEVTLKNIGGTFVMYAGNSNQTGGRTDLNSFDNSIWIQNNGNIFQYLIGDHLLDADINSFDRAIWIINNGHFQLIPY